MMGRGGTNIHGGAGRLMVVRMEEGGRGGRRTRLGGREEGVMVLWKEGLLELGCVWVHRHSSEIRRRGSAWRRTVRGFCETRGLESGHLLRRERVEIEGQIRDWPAAG